ncbi:MAG: hypothetical protein K0Q55_3198 [Verrucomicrobia bacterium]|jgi:hypothetical protein|nr:hypothetical protein [Verrucomicrobiota bacterium]
MYITELKPDSGVNKPAMSTMRPFIRQAVVAVSASTLMLGATVAFGIEDTGNPYADIATRNAFGLKPPEPPKLVEPPKVEQAPSNIILTGLSSINGKKQIYLKVTVPGEKEPQYMRLAENERQGAIEVTEIIPKGGRVRIKNGGVPSELSFEKNGNPFVAAAPQAPIIPGRPPGMPGGVPPVPGAAPAANNPVGGAVSSTLPVSPNNTAVGQPRPATTTTISPTAQPNNSTGTRSIPSRPLRVNPNGGGASYDAPPAPNINPAAQAVQIEVNRTTQPTDFPPLPPTPLSQQN